ncbi:dihydrodipicolinate synthase family protein [Variovorax paradoxus]|uniref:4-hydroxy-tetrahydrodipicolinate synthase n=1 Tax=Variovorax paradoxus TaxID=34073 RepID=A0A0H2LUJ5_VARPD|nr:dihydrodipicolinate synthase family protein [Variovorax paradoxus]KLN52162.1 4-hydroxy-tetrahydrodipicolinate synthase [Variovorax paradoxus]
MADFRGTYTIMVTPFDAEGNVDVPTLERYVDWQIESGIHGLIPLGSTGEFMSMSDDEIALVARTVIDRAAGRVPVLIGTTAEDTRAAVRLSRRAEAQGADGVMVLPPFYCTPTDDELFLHYRTISDAIGIPIMVYNNPAVANVDLKPPLVARLSQIDNCRYIKESTLEVTRVRDIMRLSEGRMAVFGGIMGFESYVEGAVGWAAVPSNGAPREMARLYDLVMAGQLAEARALAFKHFPMIDFVAGQSYVAGTKALLAAMGLPAGAPRPPRLPMGPEGIAAARRLVDELGLKIQTTTA